MWHLPLLWRNGCVMPFFSFLSGRVASNWPWTHASLYATSLTHTRETRSVRARHTKRLVDTLSDNHVCRRTPQKSFIQNWNIPSHVDGKWEEKNTVIDTDNRHMKWHNNNKEIQGKLKQKRQLEVWINSSVTDVCRGRWTFSEMTWHLIKLSG